MAKARAAARQRELALKYDVLAICLATAGALLLASLVYRGDAVGVVPSRVSTALRLTVGIGAYAVPLAIFLISAFFALGHQPVAGGRVIGGVSLMVVALLVLLQVRVNADWETQLSNQEALLVGGGYVGAALAWVLLRLLGLPGAYIFIVGVFSTGVVLITKATMRQMLEALGQAILEGAEWVGSGARNMAARQQERRRLRPARRRRPPRKLGPPHRHVDLDDPPSDASPSTPDSGVSSEEGPSVPAQVPSTGPSSAKETGAGRRKPRTRVPSPGVAPGPGQQCLFRPSDTFTLPSPEMLTEYPHEVESAAQREEAAEQIIKLEDTLASFGISARVTHYERGPVLTRYEVEPERGIRVNQVVRLADDLAMALAAVDVRVEAPIPGKSAIGIEVPNETRATVSLRGLLTTREFQEHPSKLAFALGRDIAGQPVIPDIATMPHLLIAGATGSGKSVCLHSTIVSLLMRATPDEVRLIMVDPKRVELAVYDGIPHLMAPVVHSVKQAADVLRKAIREMEKRYDKFALKGVVNLDEYNGLARMAKEHPSEEFEPLPRVVIIIDELADLMMQARAEFEFSICRIAQLARATGIHLVLATQRPSVKVVTGNIKANIPSRIALAVASQHDSRTILDGQGAERLIGRGDMLYAPLDASKPLRVQGAFVSRSDIERVVEHLRAQGEPDFQIIPEVPEDEEDFSGEMDASDELFAAAVQYVIQEGEASVSMIQRRFKVGYARAGRLVDMMEQRGIVGPHEGSRPRQVLVGPHAVDQILQGRKVFSIPDHTDEEQEDRQGLPGHPEPEAVISHTENTPDSEGNPDDRGSES